jgi:hypothetical protein
MDRVRLRRPHDQHIADLCGNACGHRRCPRAMHLRCRGRKSERVERSRCADRSDFRNRYRRPGQTSDCPAVITPRVRGRKHWAKVPAVPETIVPLVLVRRRAAVDFDTPQSTAAARTESISDVLAVSISGTFRSRSIRRLKKPDSTSLGLCAARRLFGSRSDTRVACSKHVGARRVCSGSP